MRSLNSLNSVAGISTPKLYWIQSPAEYLPGGGKWPADVGANGSHNHRLRAGGSAELQNEESTGLSPLLQKVDLSTDTWVHTDSKLTEITFQTPRTLRMAQSPQFKPDQHANCQHHQNISGKRKKVPSCILPSPGCRELHNKHMHPLARE